jgi:DNA-binding LacI/PurR family transcriptional regulator
VLVPDLAARDYPMVLVNRTAPGLSMPSVSVDFFGGMMQVCGHLAQLGHHQVAYLSGPQASWANGERIRAFSSVEPFGLHITVIPCGSTSRDGYDTAPAVRGTDATTIITYNDLVALGALTRLRELGIAVPDQISIAGFDDISLDRSAHSIVTTVSVPRDRLGRDAADLLEQLMTTGHDCEPQSLPMQLLVRDTTAPPPADRGA